MCPFAFGATLIAFYFLLHATMFDEDDTQDGAKAADTKPEASTETAADASAEAEQTEAA